MIKILDFWANWCYPCKIMEPIISEAEKELESRVVFEKINVDQNPEISQKYNIMSIPTYVVLEEEKEVDRLIGATSKENFSNFVKKNLPSE